MHSPSRRLRHLTACAAISVSVVAAAVLISQSSYRAFSAPSRDSGAESVSVALDARGTARFHVTNMVPGQTETKCIKVTSFSLMPGIVRLYLLNAVHSPQHLEDHILFSVRVGAGGGFASCAGFVASEILAARTLADGMNHNTNYATGFGSWATAGVSTGESKTYALTWTFDASGLTQAEVNGLQGASTGVDLQWELQTP